MPPSKRAISTALIVLVGCFAWVVLASLFFCNGIDHRELFTPPYLQWLQVIPSVPLMLWMPHSMQQAIQHPLLWFVLPTLPPIAFLLALGLRKFRRPNQQPLFGMSEFAKPHHLKRNNLDVG